MDNELQKEIEMLKAQIKELQEWKEEKERQQISNPLDVASTNVLINALNI